MRRSVSYTHLGEEHRSGKGTLMVGFLLVVVILKILYIFIRIIEGFMPVSYTHLDVYKRQVQ